MGHVYLMHEDIQDQRSGRFCAVFDDFIAKLFCMVGGLMSMYDSFMLPNEHRERLVS